MRLGGQLVEGEEPGAFEAGRFEHEALHGVLVVLPVARSRMIASTMYPPLQYENRSPGVNFCGCPSSIGRKASAVVRVCTGSLRT